MYKTFAKFLLKFDDESLYEDISQNIISDGGTINDITYETEEKKIYYKMKENQYFNES